MMKHLRETEVADVFKAAADRVLKTRADTILTNRFYGVLISNVEAVMSRKFPTAATNGKQHYFNPDFVMKLNKKELKFTQRHETEHDARHHSTRRGNREPKEWNICCDFAINIDIVDEIAAGDHSMEVPREEILGGKIYCDAKYRGMSAEDIYRSRELDRQAAEKAKQQQQPQPGQADDEDDDSQEAGNEDTSEENGDETESEKGSSSDADDDETGDQAGSDQAGDDQDADEGDTDGDGSDAGEEAGSPQDGSDTGKGADGDASGEPTEDSEDGEAEGQGEGDEEGEASGKGGEPASVTGEMAGGLGEVLDASDDPVEISDEEAKWERVVRQAAAIAKNRGDAPGYAIREIERANQSKKNWREELRAFFDQGATQIETWNRPNRRFVGTGTILPGSQREGLNSVVFLIDTSGSCDDVALAKVSAEAQAALDEGIINDLYVVYGDTRVTRVDQYVAGDNIEFDPKGGGGTAMRPLFDWTRENIDNPSLIVCFTDLEIEPEAQLGEQPACPVLWAVHGYPDRVRSYIANAPWGAPGIDVGAD